MPEVVVRKLKPQDRRGISRLYASSQPDAPFFRRDEDYFDYFSTHPDVREDSIFVAASQNGIEGVAIMAVVCEKYALGRIIELRAGGAAAGKALLTRAVDYCRDNHIDAVELSSPVLTDMANLPAGWWPIDRGGRLMAKPLSLAPLLRALAGTPAVGEIGIGRRFLFLCREEAISLRITESGSSVTRRNPSRPGPKNAVTVRLSPATLLGVLSGSLSPYLALVTGRIKVRGIRNTFLVMKLFKAIRINRPWLVAMADAR
jgi:hypothetical protein